MVANASQLQDLKDLIVAPQVANTLGHQTPIIRNLKKSGQHGKQEPSIESLSNTLYCNLMTKFNLKTPTTFQASTKRQVLGNKKATDKKYLMAMRKPLRLFKFQYQVLGAFLFAMLLKAM